MKALEEIKDFFEGDRFAMENGIEILEAEAGHALCRMKVTRHHQNARGVVMGGAIFTLADFTFAVAANAEGGPCVTLSSEIHYLSPASGEELFAKAEPIKHGRTVCHYRISVWEGEKRQIAEITACGYKLEGGKS